MPWVAGRFYSSNMYTGALTTFNTVDTLIAAPVFVPNDVTITTLGIEVSTGGTAGLNVACAIYSHGNGVPDALLAETGALDGSAAAFVSTTISLALTAGTWYWLACQIENGVSDPVVRALTQAACAIRTLGYSTADSVTPSCAWSVARAYTDAFPATFTGGGAISTALGMPRVLVSF